MLDIPKAHLACELWVIGDPIQDVWLYGEIGAGGRFVASRTVIREGGAFNAYTNALEMTKKSSVSVWWGSNVERHHQLIRFIADNLTMNTWDYFGDTTQMYAHGSCALGSGTDCKRGLLLSEYNKGLLNKHNRIKPDGNIQFEFAVVDSRYRTLDIKWLKNIPLKIWHATGAELDMEWAQHFDFVFHTNGPQAVSLIGLHSDRMQTLQVPNTIVVDPIGAGDTFSAAVAVYLAAHLSTLNSFETICNAGLFGIHVCQEVIVQKHTATPYTTLKEYLNNHVHN
jgi:hypothetical protein